MVYASFWMTYYVFVFAICFLSFIYDFDLRWCANSEIVPVRIWSLIVEVAEWMGRVTCQKSSWAEILKSVSQILTFVPKVFIWRG